MVLSNFAFVVVLVIMVLFSGLGIIANATCIRDVLCGYIIFINRIVVFYLAHTDSWTGNTGRLWVLSFYFVNALFKVMEVPE